ncbi:MAG: hypothetical protein JSV00_02520 [bacterium]|nr:MAG: hypothetical protein JSV00_02520 [bacterium]
MSAKGFGRCLFTCIVSVGLLAANCLADSAEVLPKGISNLSVTSTYYLPIDTEFGPGGDKEKVYADYTGLSIASLFGLDLGTTVIDFEYEYFYTYITYQYGLSDRVSIGLTIPFSRQKTDLGEARIDTSGGDAATLAFIGCSGVPGADDACATQFILDQLETTLGYEWFETWSDSGIGDIIAGLRYQYYRDEDWQLAFTGGITFPTGEVDDPDNLLDTAFGNGAYVLNFHFNNDFKGIEDLVLNGTFRYEMVLPAKETLRVPPDVNIPITDVKERVDRDIGDTIELELSGKYSLSDTWSLGLVYKYGLGMKNRVSGDYPSLEDETDYIEHVYTVDISYSTVSLYMDKKFSVPMAASLAYRDRFAGENANNSQYLAFGLSVYF